MLNSFFRLNVLKIFCTKISFYLTITKISVEYNIKKKKHLKIDNFKTTYNESSKLKLKVIKLTSAASIRKGET